jgi:hypothetical protein
VYGTEEIKILRNTCIFHVIDRSNYQKAKKENYDKSGINAQYAFFNVFKEICRILETANNQETTDNKEKVYSSAADTNFRSTPFHKWLIFYKLFPSIKYGIAMTNNNRGC